MLTDRDRLTRVLVDQLIINDCYGLRKIGEPHTVVDIGANVGVFSLMARILFPRARVIAVEPCPQTFNRLVENLKFFHVEAKNVGLSLSPFIGLIPGRDSGSTTSTQVQDPKEFEGTSVVSKTLSDMFRSWSVYPRQYPVLLKVDCEGAERSIAEHPQSEATLVDCAAVACELHYGEGRGAEKWPSAMTRDEGRTWLTHLKKVYPGTVEYEETSMGSVVGGILRAWMNA